MLFLFLKRKEDKRERKRKRLKKLELFHTQKKTLANLSLFSMAPTESQAPEAPADPAKAQSIFARVASTTGSGTPCSKGEEMVLKKRERGRDKRGSRNRWLEFSLRSIDDGSQQSANGKKINLLFFFLLSLSNKPKKQKSARRSSRSPGPARRPWAEGAHAPSAEEETAEAEAAAAL